MAKNRFLKNSVHDSLLASLLLDSSSLFSSLRSFETSLFPVEVAVFDESDSKVALLDEFDSEVALFDELEPSPAF
jgi:hypothetical protein